MKIFTSNLSLDVGQLLADGTVSHPQYDTGLAAYWLDDWDRAARAFQAILDARRVLARIAETDPDYPDEDGLHALVEENIAALERQKKLEDLYSQALAGIDSGALADARALLSQIQELEPGYAETGCLVTKVVTLIQRQAEERQRQEQIDALYNQAIALARAEQWPEVLSKLAAIRRLLPQFEDPQDLLATAERRIELAEQESRRQEELAALYAHAVQLLNAGNHQQALEKWAELHAQDPGYPDREKVQFRAKAKFLALSLSRRLGK